MVEHLMEYIAKAEPLRKQESKLFISYVKPHRAVSKDTVARWVKQDSRGSRHCNTFTAAEQRQCLIVFLED